MITKLLSLFKKPNIMELPQPDMTIQEVIWRIENEKVFKEREKRITTDLFEEIVMDKHYRPIKKWD